MNIPCTSCELHEAGCKTICMPGVGNQFAKLQIWLDAPGIEADRKHDPEEGKSMSLVKFLLARNSILPEQYYVGFVIRCMPPKNFLKKKDDKLTSIEACDQHKKDICKVAKAIVSLGELSILAFSGKQPKDRAGMYEQANGVRIYYNYSPGYLLQNPADTVSVSRSIWNAAVFTGLKPAINYKLLTSYDYGML